MSKTIKVSVDLEKSKEMTAQLLEPYDGMGYVDALTIAHAFTKALCVIAGVIKQDFICNNEDGIETTILSWLSEVKILNFDKYIKIEDKNSND